MCIIIHGRKRTHYAPAAGPARTSRNKGFAGSLSVYDLVHPSIYLDLIFSLSAFLLGLPNKSGHKKTVSSWFIHFETVSVTPDLSDHS